jgi:histidinol-phosphate/aromatic aminotransferase/cobyric acid decarboxylase-like protein
MQVDLSTVYPSAKNPTTTESYFGPGMIGFRVLVPKERVVLWKGTIEAHDGIAHVFGERGGELLIAAPSDRESELRQLVCELLIDFSSQTAV